MLRRTSNIMNEITVLGYFIMTYLRSIMCQNRSSRLSICFARELKCSYLLRQLIVIVKPEITNVELRCLSVTLYGHTFHVPPVDLCVIFQCNSYISCIMSCGNKIVSNCFKLNLNAFFFATPNFNKRTETFQITIDDTVRYIWKIKSKTWE